MHPLTRKISLSHPHSHPQQSLPSSSSDLIQDLFSKLNSQINKVQSIVEQSVTKKETVFLTAYRKQMFEIRQDLDQLKNSKSAVEHQRVNTELKETIKKLKEELMEIFVKLEEKSKELDETRIRLDHEVKGNQFLEQEIKKLMKKIKSNHEPSYFPTEIKGSEAGITKNKEQVRKLATLTPMNRSSREKPSTKRENTQEKIFRILRNESQTKQVIEVINERETQERRSASHSQRVWQKKYTSRNLYERTELENLFLECTRVVQRRILKSNSAKGCPLSSNSQMDNLKDQDKDEILRLFLCDSQTANKLFRSVFDLRLQDTMKAGSNR